MKKIFYFSLVCVIAALSCSKEITSPEEETPATGKVPVTFSVSRDEIKTYVDNDGATLLWEEGDKIGVFTDLDTDSPCEFSMSGNPGASATFTGEVSEGASSFYVFYPYDENATFANGKITTSLPTTQTIGSNNTAKGAMLTTGLATGTGANLSVTLTPVFSYLKFKIQTEDVKTIVIGSGSVNFGGQAQFTANGGAMVSGGSANSITVTKESGYFAKDTYYYVPVLPVTVPAGEFTFAIDSNTHGSGTGTEGYDDWKAERTATAAMAFTQGRAKKFDALDADGSTNKWTWYFDIHDAASLERFRALVGAGSFPDGGLAKFTSDIDLSGVTLAAEAGTFTGTLDGQNHSITNWTATGVALINILGRDGSTPADGVVKNFTLASSCTLTFSFTNPSSRAGFVARVLNNHGTVDGITNNATVTPVTGAVSTMYAGIIAGVNYGLIQNCVNNSDISITASSVTGNIYLGAIAGYANYGTNLTLYNCTNNGNISYRVNSTGYHVYMGGISGGTSTSKVSEASMKGIIDHCLNTGNVSYVLTNGGSLDDNAGTAGSGNYFKVGGVVGYFDGDVTNCVNGVEGNATKGIVSVTVPTNETSACATGASLGGVAAFVSQNVTDCTNYGKVYFKGTLAGGTEDAAGAGAKAVPCFGGIVGQAGRSSATTDYSVSGCVNNGAMDINGWMATGNGTYFYYGGVAGWLNIPISSCTNTGNLTFVTKGAQNYAGGVYGYCAKGASNLTNSGDLNVTLARDNAEEANKQCQAGFNRIGGVAGHSLVSFSSCSNSGTITVTGSANSGIYCPLIGGVSGHAEGSFTSSNNTGDIVLNYPANGTSGFRLGGLIGHSGLSLSGVTNNGNISVTTGALTAGANIGGTVGYQTGGTQKTTNTGNITVSYGDLKSNSFVGGNVGWMNAGTQSGSNTGNILVSTQGDMSGIPHIGGSVAYSAEGTLSGITNSGSISYTMPSGSTQKDNVYVGGIIGRTTPEKVTSATNLTCNAGTNQPITVNIAAQANKQMYIGGVIGLHGNATARTYSNLKNYKDISVTVGSSASTSFQYIGGVSANDKGSQTFSSCENYGDITYSGPQKLRLAGIASYTNQATSNCTVACDITANCSSSNYSEIGGIIGYTAATGFTGCTYTGTLDTSASSSKVYTGGILGKSNGNQAFNGCSVSGALAANVNAPGLYVGGLQANGLALTFGGSTKCVVGSGTTLNGAAVTALNNANLVSQSSDGGTYTSTGTLTNIVIE